jgi:hypothetical protein
MWISAAGYTGIVVLEKIRPGVTVVLENSTRRNAAAKEPGSQGELDEGWVPVDDLRSRQAACVYLRLKAPRQPTLARAEVQG